MANPALAAGHHFVWDIQIEGVLHAPAYLREIGWKCPTEPADGFIPYAKCTKYDAFEYMAKVRLDRSRDFHLFMGSTMGPRRDRVEWYPVEKNILTGFEDGGTLLVDVEGGKGHDLLAFARMFPGVKGRLVLEDIPGALGMIQERDIRLVFQEQDFFQPNVVVGARVYSLHHILHDWSDKYAWRSLRHVRDAMTPGYSKLLIHDLVLPNAGATRYQAAWDLCMMTFKSGFERSRAQWEDLLCQAGLEIVGFYHGLDGEDADGIVEAMVMK